MVNKKQVDDSQNSQVDDQTKKGMEVVNQLQQALLNIAKTQESMVNAINVNTKAIEEIAKQKSAPMIPPELVNAAIKAIPELIKGIMGGGEGEGMIKQGNMDVDLYEAYKESMKSTWKTNSDQLLENLKSMQLENKLKEKKLSDEF